MNYSETICKAVDTIVSAKLEGLQYDITKICTIVNDTEKNKGKYVVSDGSIRFDAYSDIHNYREGNSVLVNIPNGDFNLQKTITGKYNTVNNEPFNYTPPLENMVSIFDTGGESAFTSDGSLLANSPEANKTCISLGEFTSDQSGFTRLGISADFKTLLGDMDVNEGSYGLRITLTDNKNNHSYVLTLNNDDMFGNPYRYMTYFNQEKVFDISMVEHINKIKIEFYQSQNFKDGNSNSIPYQEDFKGITTNLPDNIFVQNVKLFLGYDSNAFTGETLLLYTSDPLKYSSEDANGLDRTIHLRWIHQTEEGNFKLLTELTEGFKVYWYNYELGKKKDEDDKYSFAHWGSTVAENVLAYTAKMNIAKQTEEFKVVGVIEKKSDTSINNEDITEDVIGEEVYTSAILTFENIFEIPNQVTIDADSALSIHFEDGSNGNYFIYNQNGKLIDDSQGRARVRKLRAYFKNAAIDENTGLEEIEWLIPHPDTSTFFMSENYCRDRSNNSTDSSSEDYYQEYHYLNKKYYKLIYKASKDDISYIAGQETGIIQKYGINEELSTQSSSTIVCKAKIKGIEYTAMAEVGFGKAGTTGTNVTFVLNFKDNQVAMNVEGLKQTASAYLSVIDDTPETDENPEIDDIYSSEGYPVAFIDDQGSGVTVEASLYDINGKKINIPEDKTITWSWKNSQNAEEKQYITIPKDHTGESVDLQFGSSLTTEVPKDNYYVLQATLEGYGDGYDLTAYLPIPIKLKSEYGFISGAKEVIYNLEGAPSYYSGAYCLYDSEGKEKTVDWKIYPYDDDEDLESEEGFDAKLKRLASGMALQAPSLYLQGMNDKVCVCALVDGAVVWSQPILITQNAYEFSLLNEWNGNLTIDDKNGTILSTMIGAGKKESDNTFTGVLLGDIRSGTGNNITKETGVYGFANGVITYALKENGTATFGPSGLGQIIINGNGGTIESSTYDNDNKTGMKIDLKTGLIDAYNFKLTSSKILIDSSDDAKPYFQVKDDKDNILIHIGNTDENDKYYLQSSDKNTKLDLQGGSFTSKSDSGSITIQSKDPYFQIKGKIPIENEVLSNASDKILMHLGTGGFYLQSANYAKDYALIETVKKESKGENGDVIKDENGNIIYEDSYALNIYENAAKEYIGIRKEKNQLEVYKLSKITINEQPFYLLGEKVGFKEITGVYKSPDDGKTDISYTISAETQLNDFISKYNPIIISGATTERSGLKIDLQTGIIDGYGLFLRGKNPNNDSQQFLIDSGAITTPLSIGNKFKVNWDGSLTCDKINYLGTSSKTSNYVININDAFTVTSSGGASGSSIRGGSGTFGSLNGISATDIAKLKKFAEKLNDNGEHRHSYTQAAYSLSGNLETGYVILKGPGTPLNTGYF